MKKLENLINIFENDDCSIKSISKIFDNKIKFFIQWLTNKDNSLLIFDKFRDQNNEYSDSILEQALFSLNIQIILMADRNYSYLSSNFYLITINKKIINITSVKFNKDIDISSMIAILSNFHTQINNNNTLITNFDYAMIYFPFKFGNIFSKKRYIYEINSKYMDTLRSIKSIDINRKAVLDNYMIEPNHALLNEYINNPATEYINDYAYIDYVMMWILQDDLPTYYFNLSKQAYGFEVLDDINSVFFYAVINQQNDLYNIVENHLRIPEYPSGRYSFKDMLIKLIREIAKSGNSTLYAKSMIDNPNYLILLQESFKVTALSDNDKVIYNNLAFKYPLYNSIDYESHLTNILNEHASKLNIDVKYIVSAIFGEDSTYYSSEDTRRFFFKEIKTLFNIYESSSFNTKTFKDLFDYHWSKKILKIKRYLSPSRKTNTKTE